MKNYKEVDEAILDIAQTLGSFNAGFIGDIPTFIEEMRQEGWDCRVSDITGRIVCERLGGGE